MVIGISLSVAQGNLKDIFEIKSDLRWDKVELTYNNLSKLEGCCSKKRSFKISRSFFQSKLTKPNLT
jgi:hypothetical protein